MPLGTIKRFHSDRGFGFIKPLDGGEGDELFFHITAIDDGSDVLVGERVGYQIEKSRSANASGRDAAVHIRYV